MGETFTKQWDKVGQNKILSQNHNTIVKLKKMMGRSCNCTKCIKIVFSVQ